MIGASKSRTRVTLIYQENHDLTLVDGVGERSWGQE